MDATPQSNDDTVAQIAALIGGQGDEDGQPAPTVVDDSQEHDPDSGPGEETTADVGTDSPDSLHDLFGLKPPEGVAEDTPADADSDPEPDTAVTVKELAEKVGVEAKDLYDELVIPLGDDETTTLGEWKDRVKSLKSLDEERADITQIRNDYEKSLLQTRTELSALMQLLPEENRAELVKAAQERAGNYETEQQQAVLEAIPAWKDQDQLAKDRAGLVDMGSEYGFSEHEITYTQDSRTLRMLHDFLRLRERINSIETATKRKSAGPNKAGKPVKAVKGSKLAQAIRAAKASPDNRVKEAVVSQLISGQ